MASYSAAIGVYGKTLVANTVDSVTLTNPSDSIEVYTDGAAAIYVTTDGTTPTVGGGSTWEIPAVQSVRRLQHSQYPVVVKLISAGTPTYSVNLES